MRIRSKRLICSRNSDEKARRIMRRAFLYSENHSLGEWFKRGYCR